jgi:hypothetical protein
MREFLIFFFKFDDFLLTFLTNCFYRTVENFLNNIIIIEKIYVDNECLAIMLNSSAVSSMAQRHYGSRDCRPLRELKEVPRPLLSRSRLNLFSKLSLVISVISGALINQTRTQKRPRDSRRFYQKIIIIIIFRKRRLIFNMYILINFYIFRQFLISRAELSLYREKAF